MQVIDPDDPLFYNPEDMKEAFDAYFRQDRSSRNLKISAVICCVPMTASAFLSGTTWRGWRNFRANPLMSCTWWGGEASRTT